MKLQPGILFCLLAGCAVQPTLVETQEAAREPIAALGHLSRGNPLCIGVEFLPPAADETAVAVLPAAARAEPAFAFANRVAVPPPERSRRGRYDLESRHTWTITAAELTAMRDPVARETMHFVDLVVAEDRKLARREHGDQILTPRTVDLMSPGLTLASEDALADEQEQRLVGEGIRLLQRPCEHLLRDLPLTRAIDLSFDDDPVADRDQATEDLDRATEAHGLGRMSMRVNVRDLYDPAELVWIKSGFRVGSGLGHLKLGCRQQLFEKLDLNLHVRHEYGGGSWRGQADLAWRFSDRTSLHCVAGDDLDFLSTSTVYSLFESPMDGSRGIVVYALHVF